MPHPEDPARSPAPAPFRARAVAAPGLLDLAHWLRSLDVDPGGIPLMAGKGVWRTILVEQVSPQAANIIKQEALARGAEAAVPRSVGNLEPLPADLLLFGSVASLRSLIAKLFRQPVFRLPSIAEAIQAVLISTVPGYLPVARRNGSSVPEETLDDYLGGRLVGVPGGRAPQYPTLSPQESLPGETWSLAPDPWPVLPVLPEGPGDAPEPYWRWSSQPGSGAGQAASGPVTLVTLEGGPIPSALRLVSVPAGTDLTGFTGVAALRLQVGSSRYGGWYEAALAALQAARACGLLAEQVLFEVPAQALPELEPLRSLGRPVLVDIGSDRPEAQLMAAVLRGADLVRLPEASLLPVLELAGAVGPMAPISRP